MLQTIQAPGVADQQPLGRWEPQPVPTKKKVRKKGSSHPKRKVDVVVISDVHLGTYGCHAKELLQYLKSIKPGMVILNGDIIDIWQFSKRYWPDSHMAVVKHLIKWVSKGVPVFYLTGNHDEMLRKFKGFRLGSFQILNKLELPTENGKAWIFHGDVFDLTMKHSKWLAKLGGKGYDLLILLNRAANFVSEKLGKGKISFSKKIKENVKSAVSFISEFEQVAAGLAIDNQYSHVICGHIHQPTIRTILTQKGSVVYMNSGDWVENLTSLEMHQGNWSLYHFEQDPVAKAIPVIDKVSTQTSRGYEEFVKDFLPSLNIKEPAGQS